MDLFDLTSHTSVVTGGNGGIGLGLASGLAKQGANVAIWARNEEKNSAAASHLEDLGADVLTVRCDVADSESVAAAMGETLSRFGAVHSLFVNAGVSGAAPFTEMTSEEFQRVIDINVTGAFLCMQIVVTHMLERSEGGSIVAVASVAASKGLPRSPHYSASKGGVRQLARSLAAEVGRKGINVNVISPGFVRSDMTADWQANEGFDEMIRSRVPLARWGNPEDFERIAVFLAAEQGGYLSGSEILIDGGLSSF